MGGSLICVVSVDVDREVEDGFNAWYEQHIRDVIAVPGWLRATRYRCLDGEPRYMSVYELESRDHAAFGALANWPPALQDMQRRGYEEFWPHLETYRARTYERISHVSADRTASLAMPVRAPRRSE